MADVDIYGGDDPRDLPVYPLTLAAALVDVPRTTARRWARGDAECRPIISVPDGGHLLSFNNLVELGVLGALRNEHGLKVERVREAVEYVGLQLGEQRPLLSGRFLTDGADVFVEHLGRLINVRQPRQEILRQVLEGRMARVELDDHQRAARYFPSVKGSDPGARIIVVDPRVAFGRPTITGTGVPLEVIIQRFEAGEAIDAIVDDYGLDRATVESALRQRQAA